MGKSSWIPRRPGRRLGYVGLLPTKTPRCSTSHLLAGTRVRFRILPRTCRCRRSRGPPRVRAGGAIHPELLIDVDCQEHMAVHIHPNKIRVAGFPVPATRWVFPRAETGEHKLSVSAPFSVCGSEPRGDRPLEFAPRPPSATLLFRRKRPPPPTTSYRQPWLEPQLARRGRFL